MADFLAHLHQAKYNKIFAIELARSGVRRDWAITVAFYAALHFAEAGLIGKNKISTTDKNLNDDKALDTRRADLLLASYGDLPYRKYKKLMNESSRARYLDNQSANFDDPPAQGYFPREVVDDLINNELESFWEILTQKCPCDLS